VGQQLTTVADGPTYSVFLILFRVQNKKKIVNPFKKIITLRFRVQKRSLIHVIFI